MAPATAISRYSKVLIGVGIGVTLAAVVTGVAIAAGGSDDPPPSFSSAPAPTTVMIDGRSVEVGTWTATRWPEVMLVAEQMVSLYSKSEVARSRAVSSCAGWMDEVEEIAALPPAPDPVMESEFRAMVSEGLVALEACQSGDVEGMRQHLSASKEHRVVMDARVEELRSG